MLNKKVFTFPEQILGQGDVVFLPFPIFIHCLRVVRETVTKVIMLFRIWHNFTAWKYWKVKI